jgi:hypothetical protein
LLGGKIPPIRSEKEDDEELAICSAMGNAVKHFCEP